MGKAKPKKEQAQPLSREGAKVQRRKARKAEKRSRLARALAGEFTPVRRVA